MPVELTAQTAALVGQVTAEDAEPLARWLRETEGAMVDLGDCAHLHAAALQALLAARAPIVRPPEDPFLARWVLPALDDSTKEATP